MKAIFESRPGSGYDDEIVRRYHFPTRRNYLAAAQSAIGDWIVYYEPRRQGGRQAYIAVAKVSSVEPDPSRTNHAYALMSEFLPLDPPVPFAGGRWEGPLREIADRAHIGGAMQGRSLRPLAQADFAAIVGAGLAETLDPENAIRLGLSGFEETQAPFLGQLPGEEQVRRIEQMLVNRKIRDANFRRQVCAAYDDRCAVTGLRIVNGGGRAEVQAAHIWSVAEGGPDIVQNGVALSGTAHWLFDRHLISLTDDYRLLVSHNKVPAELRGLFEKQMDRIHLPRDERLWPYPRYVSRHRETFLAA